MRHQSRRVSFHLAMVILLGTALNAAAPKPSRTTFSSSARQVEQGKTVTLKALVSPLAAADGIPSGSVEFFDGATSLGTAELSAVDGGLQGALTLTLALGPHPISVKYSGDASFAGSVSVPEFVLVVARR
jgi:hypothetical protein